MNKTLIVNEFLKFLETIEILRSENGCPWDKVQTPESMRGALIEEAIEASSAISEKNPCHAKEELGDLFLNTLMISYMYEQNNDFCSCGSGSYAFGHHAWQFVFSVEF